ncbi:hypothetical protein DESA109040_19390 [Deinococcus saxicola]
MTSALVLGAGQAGGPLAGALARAGWDVTLVERVHVGGTCVNEGCTPTKAMLASAKAAHVARSSAALGVHAKVQVSLPEIVDRVQGIVKTFRDGSAAGLKSAGVTLMYGVARFTGVREMDVTLQAGGRTTLGADYVFINTGTRPRWPAVPGLDVVGAMTSDALLHLRELPAHLLSLGGGYISLDSRSCMPAWAAASRCSRPGRVCCPVRMPTLQTRCGGCWKTRGLLFTWAFRREEPHAGVTRSVWPGGMQAASRPR